MLHKTWKIPLFIIVLVLSTMPLIQAGDVDNSSDTSSNTE